MGEEQMSPVVPEPCMSKQGVPDLEPHVVFIAQEWVHLTGGSGLDLVTAEML